MAEKPRLSVYSENVKYFDALCEKSVKSKIDWKRFKALDKKNKNLFSRVSMASLYYIHRFSNLKKKGLCITCGKKPAINDGINCYDCASKYRIYSIQNYKSKKDKVVK